MKLWLTVHLGYWGKYSNRNIFLFLWWWSILMEVHSRRIWFHQLTTFMCLFNPVPIVHMYWCEPWFHPTTFLCLSETMSRGLFGIKLFEMRGGCSFVWDERWLLVCLRWEVVTRLFEMRDGCSFVWDERWLLVCLRWEMVVPLFEMRGGCSFVWDERWLVVCLRWEVVARLLISRWLFVCLR